MVRSAIITAGLVSLISFTYVPTCRADQSDEQDYERGMVPGAGDALLLVGTSMLLTDVILLAVIFVSIWTGPVFASEDIPVLETAMLYMGVVGLVTGVSGAVMLGVGLEDEPEDDARHDAWRAGFEVGLGGGLIGAGAFLALTGVGFGLFGPDQGDGSLIAALVFGTIGLVMIGGGVALVVKGQDDYDAVNSGTDMMAVPLLQFSF